MSEIEITQADQWCAHQIMHHEGPLCEGSEIVARHRIEATAPLQQRIDYLEHRLETEPGWSEDADGIACRDDTIRLQDKRIADLEQVLKDSKHYFEHYAEALQAENAELVSLLREAQKALHQHACHGEDAPCRRDSADCRLNCGFTAGAVASQIDAKLKELGHE